MFALHVQWNLQRNPIWPATREDINMFKLGQSERAGNFLVLERELQGPSC